MLVLNGIGIFFSILLLIYNKGYKSANVYLGLFLFLFNFITFSHYIYIFSNSKAVLAFVMSIPINASAYAIGPLAFLYVRSILRDNAKLTKYDGLHFVFFAVNFMGRLPYNFESWEEKYRVANDIINLSWEGLSLSNQNNILPIRFNYVLKGIHLFLYLIAVWGLILKNKINISSFGKVGKQLKIVKNWLFFFAIMATFLGVCLALIGLLFLNAKEKNIFQYEGNILFLLVFIGLITLILGLVLFPQILYGIPIEKLKLAENNNEIKEPVGIERESFSFHEDYIDRIRMLLEIWRKEHKFLNPDSSTHIMSKEIGLPLHHVTYFFNQINNEKYIDWRNRLRVEYAIDLLNRQKGYNKTIEVLGKECGFKSYSAFFQSFKQITGKLPKEYIRDIRS
jgi:AraC-like DNA-binding protein